MTRARPAGSPLRPGDTIKGSSIIYYAGRGGENQRYVDRITGVEYNRPSSIPSSRFNRLSPQKIIKLPRSSYRVIPKNHPYGKSPFGSTVAKQTRKDFLSARHRQRFGRMPVMRGRI